VDNMPIFLIVCLALFIGIGLPAAAFFWVRGKGTVTMIETIRRTAEATRQPWQKQERDLEELSRRVSALREDRPDQGDKDDDA
jgi:hypothetical protein